MKQIKKNGSYPMHKSRGFEGELIIEIPAIAIAKSQKLPPLIQFLFPGWDIIRTPEITTINGQRVAHRLSYYIVPMAKDGYNLKRIQ